MEQLEQEEVIGAQECLVWQPRRRRVWQVLVAQVGWHMVVQGIVVTGAGVAQGMATGSHDEQVLAQLEHEDVHEEWLLRQPRASTTEGDTANAANSPTRTRTRFME